MVGISFTIIATVDVEAVQGKLEMVHAKIVVPTAKPVMLVVGDNEFVIDPLPETKVHAPEPTTGALAAIVVVGLEIQSV